MPAAWAWLEREGLIKTLAGANDEVQAIIEAVDGKVLAVDTSIWLGEALGLTMAGRDNQQLGDGDKCVTLVVNRVRTPLSCPLIGDAGGEQLV